MNPASMIAKVNKVMNRFTPIDRSAYLRTVTRAGDTLIGRTTTTTYVDVLINPQPIFMQLGRERLSGGRDNFEQIKTASGKMLTADDWEFLFSSTAMPLSTIQNTNVLIVLKDTSGITEVFDILDFESTGFSGADVLLSVYCRSVKRG
jgi:hypothetical protein